MGLKESKQKSIYLYGTHMDSATQFYMGPIWVGQCKENKTVDAGADPGFLAGGSNLQRGVRFESYTW